MEAYAINKTSVDRSENMFKRVSRKQVVLDLSNEKEMVLALSKGDRAAVQHLYTKYSALFFTIAKRYASNTQEAEDYVQEAFVQIYKKSNTFSFKGSFEGWMKRIVVNTCLSALRKKKITFDDPTEDNMSNEKFSENNWSIESMTADDILSCINELPMGCKTVLNLSVMEGFTHKEISKKLGIAESASRSQLTKARAKLKMLLKQKNLLEG